MVVADDLAAMEVSKLDLGRYVALASTEPVSAAVQAMRDSGYSCSCVLEDDALVGIFTQRDVLTRVLGQPGACDTPIRELMTPGPKTMRPEQTVSEGLAIMSEWWVRSVPVVDAERRLVGNLSWYTVMSTMAALLKGPRPDGTEPGVADGLSFVDFTGLNTSAPVTVSSDDSADSAIRLMTAHAIGSLLVVDAREQLVGILTEFDLLVKLACLGPDPSQVPVSDLVSSDVVTLSARSVIAEAVEQMAERGYSHAPLMGESSRPVGVASFRDIAAFLETSLQSLA